jgi:hypothetical protein
MIFTSFSSIALSPSFEWEIAANKAAKLAAPAIGFPDANP